MPKNYENLKSYTNSWYALTTNRLVVTLGSLQEEVNCDVCVVGGGFTGLSAALELAEKGLSVIVLEAGEIASGATGRNGGQILRGFAQSPGYLVDRYGLHDAKMLSHLSLEGMALIMARIQQHDIKCDLKFGHLTAAVKENLVPPLKQEIEEWKRIGYDDLVYLDRQQTQAMVRTEKYVGGMFDQKAAHFHPMNYALGLAHAAQKKGCKIYDKTRAVEIVRGLSPKVVTERGSVSAKFVIMAGVNNVQGTEILAKRVMPVTTHMIATEPIREDKAQHIMTKDIAVADNRGIMDYYHLSADRRMLFGGNCNYSAKSYHGEDKRLRARMVNLFPELVGIPLEHCWQGPLEFTINRLPDIGRISNQIYYAHGFGGQGVVATNIAGKVIAEAVAGTAQRFDVFSKIKHASFPGGDMLRRPLFVLGMTWYRLKDLL